MSFLAAAIQMTSRQDKSRNLETASRLIEDAARQGAELVVLPELFPCLGSSDEIVAGAEPMPGPTSQMLGSDAERLGITLVAGSIAERDESTGRIFNTCAIYHPELRQAVTYRKVHLFDVDVSESVTFRESDFMLAGNTSCVAATPAGRLGLAICYDLRFPELFRRLVDDGAETVCLPAAFTMTTGRDHWEVLVRARAIENQVHMIAANQYGLHAPKMESYGRSMIVDPWGTVLAAARDGEGIAIAQIDPRHQADVRRRLPSLTHRCDLERLGRIRPD